MTKTPKKEDHPKDKTEKTVNFMEYKKKKEERTKAEKTRYIPDESA